MTDDLAQEISPMLCGAFGAPLRHFTETDSTNLQAMRWANDPDNPAPEGAVVVADHQSAGKGRWGRTWSSKPGSALLCSVVLRPELPDERLDLLTTTVGVAAVEAVRELTEIDVRLKWPNDLTFEGRKLAGILVESQSSGAGIDVAIAGLGINLDLRDAFLIPEVADRATSLAQLTDAPPTRAEVLAAFLSWLEPLYRSLDGPEGPGEIVRLAEERSDVIGSFVDLQFADGRNLTGKARRIMPDGSLELEHPGGVDSVRAGEITRVRPEGGS